MDCFHTILAHVPGLTVHPQVIHHPDLVDEHVETLYFFFLIFYLIGE